MLPSLWRSRRSARASVDLPEPELADDADGLPGAQVDGDVIDGGEGACAAAEPAAAQFELHDDVAAFENRFRALGNRRLASCRFGREQSYRVGVSRVLEHCRRRPGLDDLAFPHDGDAIGNAADDAEVVGDEDQRHAET